MRGAIGAGRSAALAIAVASSVFWSAGCFGNGAAGSGRTRADGVRAAAVVEDSSGWPDELLTNDDHGPALYMGRGWGAASFGYVSPGVTVRVVGLPSEGRIPVRLDGGLKVRGWLLRSRLGARALEAGSIEGTPVVVGVGDFVRVLRPLPGGRMEVEVSPDFGRDDAPPRWSFVGTYPTRLLGVKAPEAADEAVSDGELRKLPPGYEVPLFEQPGGKIVAILPALDPPLEVRYASYREPWSIVHVGVGPYLRGYVRIDTLAVEETSKVAVSRKMRNGRASRDRVPARLRSESDKPLWKVQSGTRVEFDGATVALVEQDGWARELGRHDDIEMVDVFVAVDDDVAVRGLVPKSALRRVPKPLRSTKRR